MCCPVDSNRGVVAAITIPRAGRPAPRASVGSTGSFTNSASQSLWIDADQNGAHSAAGGPGETSAPTRPAQLRRAPDRRDVTWRSFDALGGLTRHVRTPNDSAATTRALTRTRFSRPSSRPCTRPPAVNRVGGVSTDPVTRASLRYVARSPRPAMSPLRARSRRRHRGRAIQTRRVRADSVEHANRRRPRQVNRVLALAESGRCV